MDHNRLPSYPEHREPTERIEGVEFEREEKPRSTPWTTMWRAVAFMMAAFSAVFGYYYWEKYLKVQPPARQATAPANQDEKDKTKDKGK
jgi:hypothetical protein